MSYAPVPPFDNVAIKVARSAGVCIAMGVLNAATAVWGCWVGLVAVTDGQWSPLSEILLASWPATLALGVLCAIAIPLIITLRIGPEAYYRIGGTPAMASYVIMGLALIGYAGFAMMWGIVAVILGIVALIGAAAGLVCVPFALLLWNKRFEWVVLCMAIGGFVAMPVWILGIAYIDPSFSFFGPARPPKPNEDLVFKAMFAVPVISVIGSMITVAFKAKRWRPLTLMQAPLSHCLACEYDLTGLPDSIVQCPECGAAIPGRHR